MPKIRRTTVCILSLVFFALPLRASDGGSHRYWLDDIGQFVPTLAIPALSLYGVKSKHSWRERIAVTVTSMALCECVTYTLKHTIHSTRPDGSDRHSFPSGHSARVFRGAEIIREEYGWGWGAGAYAVAAGVGALRIYHHRHRFGDVAGGAAIGFLTARAAYLLLPPERKLFGWDKSEVTAFASPVADLGNRQFGVQMTIIF